jgi:hypothetical protein
LAEKAEEHQRHRQAVEEAREQNKKVSPVKPSNHVSEKMQTIRDKTLQQLQAKADTTSRNLQLREEIAKKELDKVKKAQEHRRLMKALR